MKKFILVAGIVSAGIVVFAGGASAEVKEGKWSMTMVTKMEGMPGADEAMEAMQNMSPEDRAMMEQMMGGMKMGASPDGAPGIATTIVKCVTNDNPVPSPEEGCQTTHSLQGDTVNFESVCADSTSSGQVTYENDSMSGTIRSHQTADNTNATIELSGQYIGPCD